MVDEICRKLTRRQKQEPRQRPDYTSKDKDKDYIEKYNFSIIDKILYNRQIIFGLRFIKSDKYAFILTHFKFC